MGLLDSFFGTPDQTQAMGLLGANMMQGNTGKGFADAIQYMGGAGDRQRAAALQQMQLQNMQSEIAARNLKLEQDRRQQLFDAQFMGGGAPAAASSGGVPSPVGSPSMPGQQPQQPSNGGMTAQQISQQYGIPIEAVISDYRFNGGKKIAELIDSRSKPNWQNVNGNLVDTNARGFQGGIQAGVSAGSGGQVTAWQPDGQGGLVVGAPRGALDTFRAYQNTEQGAKAGLDPLTVTGPDGRPVMRSRLNVMQEANAPAPQAGVNGSFVGDPAQVSATIDAIKDPQEKANARAAFEAQMRASNGRLGGGIPLQSEAEKLKQNKLAEADATRQIENTNKGNQFKDFRDQLGIAKTLLQAGPTNSGFGAAMDTAAGMVGYSPPGATIAQALETTSKWLSQNVPKAPGAQSDAELKEYQGAAGLVGDKTVPVARRVAALQTVERLMDTWEARRAQAGNTGAAGGATGSFDAPKGQTFDTKPPANPSNKGRFLTDTSTGKRYQSNGMSWAEVK